MNRYFKYADEGVICYVELDEALYCLRAVYQVGEEFINTNLQAAHETYFLPEGSFGDSIDSITEIEKATFDDVWNRSVQPYLAGWNELRSRIKTGDKIPGKIICFYPQGVVLNIEQRFYGVADYDECKGYLGAEKMYPGQHVELVLEGYDDVNMWVKLKVGSPGLNFKKLLKWAPLAILIAGIAYSIYTVQTTNIVLIAKNYWGIGFTLISLLLLIIKPRIGKIALLITLLLGTFNLLAFTPVIYSYYFGLRIFDKHLQLLAVQPFSFLVLLLFVIINFKGIGRGVKEFFRD